MTDVATGTGSEQLLALLATLDPGIRDEVTRDLVRIASQRRTASDDGEGGHGRKAVTLCTWASDGGFQDGRQALGVAVRPGPTKIAKTRAATGFQLVSNGFLGADIIHVPAGEGFAPHTHPGDHLLFVLAGRGTISAAGEILETGPGQVYIVDGSATHAVGGITDHVLLSIGASHRRLDSLERQELRPFAELMAEDGTLTCRICEVTADVAEFAALGCPHSPQRFAQS